MGKYAFIDRIFGTDDEDETENEETDDEEFDGDDDAEEDGDDDDEADDDDADDDPPAEDDAMLARLDKAYRETRARVRVSDLSELRTMRSDHSAALAGRQSPTVRLRTLDIIELIDARVTDLRASRGGPRSH
jgi:hypothetical protein